MSVLSVLYSAIDGHGPDGRPSHSKLVAFVSWAFGLVWDCYFILHGSPYGFILAWTSLTFLAPYGIKGLTLWLNRPGKSE
jgi:hypothetical protein